MAFDRGVNNGITGVVSITGSPQFHVWVLAFQRRLQTSIKSFRPRGDANIDADVLSIGGNLLLNGEVRKDGYPEPSSLLNASGTVTLQYDNGATCACPVRFSACTVSHSEPNSDVWKVTIEAIITDAVTWATNGFTSAQVSPSVRAAQDVPRPDGYVSKVLDEQDLVEQSVMMIDIVGMTADTDAAEVTKIESYFGGTPPVVNHKLRSASWQRDGRYSATLTLTFGLTDTKDDIEFPGSVTTIDPMQLQSEATVTRLDVDPATLPPAGEDFVHRRTTEVRLHDGAVRATAEFGLRDTKADITYPGSPTRYDDEEIESEKVVTDVEDDGVTPADPVPDPLLDPGVPTILMSREKTRINDKQWQWRWVFSNTGVLGRIRFPKETITYDPSYLGDEEVTTAFTGDSTLPSELGHLPANPNLTLRRAVSVRIAETPTQWMHVYYWSMTSEQQDVEMGGTVISVDARDGKRSQTTTIEVVSPGVDPDTAEEICDSLWGTLRDDVNVAEVSARLRNPYRAEVRVTREYDDKRVTQNITSRQDQIYILGGTQVNIARVRQRDANVREGLFAPISVTRVTGTVTLRRRYLRANFAEGGFLGDILFRSQIGTVYGFPFLGWAAFYLKYVGVEMVSNVRDASADNRLIVVDYQFSVNHVVEVSHVHIVDDAMRPYMGEWWPTESSISPGMVDITSFFPANSNLSRGAASTEDSWVQLFLNTPATL